MLSSNQLAILGGSPVINYELEDYVSIDATDSKVVLEVMESRILSQFLGASGEFFLGGKGILNLEREWSSKFNIKNSISCNSWTSGLWLAIGSLGLEPGSEVIVSSWTMAATATTILHWNLVPVFADIQSDSFNLDPVDVERKISTRTRAIVSPDIFGQSADIESLLEICKKYDLKLVSDSAQSPGAMRNGYFAGTKSDIGGFSLNYHKHIHSGEGGVVVTNSDDLAHRMQLLRNHGEVLVGSDYTINPPFGIMGMNMRMGEIEAAIATNQLTKLSNAIASRKEAALLFEEYLKDLPGLTLPKVMPGNNHVYYIFGLKIDTQITGIDRESLVSALRAEGVPAINNGYQNIHALPLFRNQMTYKNNPLPYSLLSIKRQKEIRTTRLEKAEDLHLRTFIGINWCAKKFVKKDVQMVGEAFQKVWKNLENLKHAFS